MILNDIREYAKFALEEPDELLKLLTESENKQKQETYKKAQSEHKDGTKRLGELDMLLQKLFEQNASGKLDDDNYDTMFERYQNERKALKKEVSELSMQLRTLGEVHDNCQQWVDLIAQYKDLQALDAAIVNELCEKILIHESYREDGFRYQRY